MQKNIYRELLTTTPQKSLRKKYRTFAINWLLKTKNLSGIAGEIYGLVGILRLISGKSICVRLNRLNGPSLKRRNRTARFYPRILVHWSVRASKTSGPFHTRKYRFSNSKNNRTATIKPPSRTVIFRTTRSSSCASSSFVASIFISSFSALTLVSIF